MVAQKIIFVVGIMMLPLPTYALGVPEAVAWILSEQNQDGSWGDQAKGVEYQVYVTSSVVIALSDFLNGAAKNISKEELARIKGSIENGKSWLKIQRPRDAPGLSSHIRALGIETFSKELIDNQNPDGGWGKGPGFHSTPWYTANAILSLRAANVSELEAGAGYLVANQEDDGSWENTAIATSSAILALARIYSIKPEPMYINSARRGEGWLLSKQDEEGGWFDASSTAESVSALKAMYSYFRLAQEKSGLDEGTAFLLMNQREDGSWGASSSSKIFDDIYTTASVISSLERGLLYPALEPKVLVSVNLSSSHAMEGDRLEMAVTVSNEGFLDAANGTIEISMPAALDGKTTWAIESLGIGVRTSKRINISIPQGAVGRHLVEVDGLFAQANELERKYRIKGVNSTLEVHGKPLKLRLTPSQVSNGSKWNFSAILTNMEEVEVVVENTSAEVSEDWENISVFENQRIAIGPAGESSLKVFEAMSPRTPGVYRVLLRFLVLNPHLGARWFSFYEDLAVSMLDSYSAVPMVPSRIYNLISMTIILFTSVFLLNLLFGVDVVE